MIVLLLFLLIYKYHQDINKGTRTFVLQMDPGQDLLLAALSESGICPNDIGLFDVDSQDVAQPSTTQQVRWSLVFEWFINVFITMC